MRIAERCNVKLPKGEAHLPNFAVPAGYTRRLVLRARRARGLRGAARRGCATLEARGELRRPIADYEARLTYEIEHDQADEVPGLLPDRLGLHPLRARAAAFRSGPGRGSAAGSLVAYCLRITDVDPLHFDLYFERFLNPERVTLPDIDIDFCERRRGEVITYVTEKYGRENVAQIITFGTMKARAAVRDVGRVMEMPISEVDRVAKLIPNQLDMTLDLARRRRTRRWPSSRSATRASRSCSTSRAGSRA